MTCMFEEMNRRELVHYAIRNASTQLEKALLKHVETHIITTQRKLRVKFWSTHPNIKRRFGGTENQSLQAQLAWVKFVQDELTTDNISEHLAISAVLKYQ